MAKIIYKKGCEGQNNLSSIEGIEIELLNGQKVLIYPKYAERFYLKDIPNAEEIKQAIKNLGFLPESDREQFKAFEEKYEFFPSIYVDDKPFIKAKTKFINDNVEFRKGIVKISVEYLDE